MLITVEGVDGSGKTTFATNLVDKLINAGYNVIHTREPGGSSIGQKVRSIMVGYRTNPVTDMLLINADRIAHIQELINPGLEEGSIIVCERFVDSTYAYQMTDNSVIGQKEKDLFNHLEELVNAQVGDYKTIYLDVSMSVARERLGSRKQLDKFETEEGLMERVLRGYRERISADPSRFIMVDANLSLEELDKWLDDIVAGISATAVAENA